MARPTTQPDLFDPDDRPETESERFVRRAHPEKLALWAAWAVAVASVLAAAWGA